MSLYVRRPPRGARTPRATLREMQVLKLYLGGYDQAGVALELGISVSTVETHLRTLRAKFGASRSRDLWPLLH